MGLKKSLSEFVGIGLLYAAGLAAAAGASGCGGMPRELDPLYDGGITDAGDAGDADGLPDAEVLPDGDLEPDGDVETDGDTPVPPECNDGVDNDLDGMIDHAGAHIIQEETLHEGTGDVYDLGGFEYDVACLVVADSEDRAVFRIGGIGGEPVQLFPGETYTHSDGLTLTYDALDRTDGDVVDFTLERSFEPDPGCSGPDDDDESDDPVDPDLLDLCIEQCDGTEEVPVERPGDVLELYMTLDGAMDTADASDAVALGSGVWHTSMGDVDWHQYIRNVWSTSTGPGGVDNVDASVVYWKDDDDVVGLALRYTEGGNALMWEAEFPGAAVSRIGADGTLVDFVGEMLNIMGEDYVVFGARVDADGELELDLLAEPVGNHVQEGTTTTIECDGVEHEVTSSDVTPGADPSVRLVVDGEVTDDLYEGDNDVLHDGTLVAIANISDWAGVTYTEFYLTDRMVTFSDTSSVAGSADGTVRVNDEYIEDSEVNLVFYVADEGTPDAELGLQNIMFWLYADGAAGDEISIPECRAADVETCTGLAERLDEPEGLLSRNVNVVFRGTNDPVNSVIRLRPSGDDEYRLRVRNIDGLEHNIRFAYRAPDGTLYHGDDDDALIFEQADDPGANTNPDSFTIRPGDYFLLQSGDLSRVLRYDTMTVDGGVMFTDIGNGASLTSSTAGALPICGDLGGGAYGSVPRGGRAFDFEACWHTDAGVPALLFDLDDDGSLGGEAQFVLEDGAVLDLGRQDADSYRPTAAAPGSGIEMTLTTDETPGPGVDEIVFIYVGADASGTMIEARPLFSDGPRMYRHEAPVEHLSTGMTAYGTLVRVEDGAGSPPSMEIWHPDEQVLPGVSIVFYDQCTEDAE